ncbi:MAG: uracil-DNA glycosylase [Rhodoferax sp.]
MNLDLDTRRRAMLQEMGVRVWWPEAVTPAPAPLPAGAGAAARPADAVASAPAALIAQAPQKGPEPPAALPGDIAGMDWQALARSVAVCQACKLCAGRQAPVFSAVAPGPADWLVLGEPPDDVEERLGAPFTGQAGQLLDNMLKAVGVHRRGADGGAASVADAARAAYLTHVVKCRPASARNPEAQDLASCEMYLRREVALVQPKVILALGRFAAQALLQGSLPDVASMPLGKLRGQVYRYQGIAVVVSYHPAYLLRTPQDKARAWQDLCLARQQVAAVGQ